MPHLSRPQRILLDTLNKYGCMRLGQAERFLRLQGCVGTLNIEAIVRQLVYTGTAQRQGDYLLRREGRPDAAVVEALELMLLLAPHGVEMHQPGTVPFSLTFFKMKSSKLLRYDICPVPRSREPLVCASLEGINHKYRVIVFVLDALEQREYLSVNCEYCFAVREAAGYRFYRLTPDAPENPEPINK